MIGSFKAGLSAAVPAEVWRLGGATCCYNEENASIFIWVGQESRNKPVTGKSLALSSRNISLPARTRRQHRVRLTLRCVTYDEKALRVLITWPHKFIFPSRSTWPIHPPPPFLRLCPGPRFFSDSVLFQG